MLVSEDPTKIHVSIRWFPADCSKLCIVTGNLKKIPSSIIVRSSQHTVVFKGRAKWFFNNPPIVNNTTNPNANNIGGVKCNDPP